MSRRQIGRFVLALLVAVTPVVGALWLRAQSSNGETVGLSVQWDVDVDALQDVGDRSLRLVYVGPEAVIVSFSARADDDSYVGLDPDDGRQLWHRSYGSSRGECCPPTVVDGRLITSHSVEVESPTAGATERVTSLVAVDVLTGREVWTLPANPSVRTVSLVDDVLVVQQSDRHRDPMMTMGVSSATGEVLWNRGDLIDVDDVGIVRPDSVVLFSGDVAARTSAHRVDPWTGEFIWSRPIARPTRFDDGVRAGPTELVVIPDGDELVGVDLSTGSTRWRHRLSAPPDRGGRATLRMTSHAALDVLYVCSTNGDRLVAEAVDLGSGGTVWARRLTNAGATSIDVQGDVVVLSDTVYDGDARCMPLGTWSVAEPTVVALADGTDRWRLEPSAQARVRTDPLDPFGYPIVFAVQRERRTQLVEVSTGAVLAEVSSGSGGVEPALYWFAGTAYVVGSPAQGTREILFPAGRPEQSVSLPPGTELIGGAHGVVYAVAGERLIAIA